MADKDCYAAVTNDEAAGEHGGNVEIASEDAAAAQDGAQQQNADASAAQDTAHAQNMEPSAEVATNTSPTQLAPASDVIDAGPPKAGGAQAAGHKRSGFSLPCFPRKGEEEREEDVKCGRGVSRQEEGQVCVVMRDR